MEENRNENFTNYEPNFVMKDPEPIAENPSYVTADTVSGEELFGDDLYDECNNKKKGPTPQPTTPTEEEGRYRDPREKFKSGASASARWSGGKARADSEYTTDSSNQGGSGFQSGISSGGFGGGGEGNFRKKFKDAGRKSKQVTLTRKSLALLIACCMVLSCLFGFAGSRIGNSMNNGSGAPVASTEAMDAASEGTVSTTGYNLQSATGSNLTIQEITKTAQKSVVEIKTEGVVSDSWMQQYVTEGAGSGVIISKEGYIMTNNHVINGANKITVTTYDKHSYEATVVGTDSVNDVAVLKIKAQGLTPAVYGNSDQLQVGDMAVAIGNPLGELGGTVTAGIISAKDRELSIDGKTMKLLQTDSSINPGNSGGGLFNGDGQLIGLVVAKSAGSDVEGLGFAIPINTAAEVAQQLMDKGYVSGQPWTGMTYTEGSSGLDFLFGDSTGGTVYIYSVETKEAKEAGFKAGDVVLAVDEHQIKSIDDLSSIISAHKVGDKLNFMIVRDGETKELSLQLQEKTKEQLQD